MDMQDNDSVVGAFSGVSCSVPFSPKSVEYTFFSQGISALWKSCQNLYLGTYAQVKSLTLVFYSGFHWYYSNTSLFLLEWIFEMHSYQHALLKSS